MKDIHTPAELQEEFASMQRQMMELSDVHLQLAALVRRLLLETPRKRRGDMLMQLLAALAPMVLVQCLDHVRLQDRAPLGRMLHAEILSFAKDFVKVEG